jgi:hypothetical protein
MINRLMARSYSHIIITRTSGPNPRNRYGIILAPLTKLFRKFLVEHRHIKRWAEDDQFVSCVLRMQKPPVKNVTLIKKYWDYTNDQLVDLNTLYNNCNLVDWTCAVSLKPIKAKFMNFDLENFIHPEYHDVLKAPMIDSRILKSSIEFRKKCKKLLLEEREEFLKLAKKNAKRRL